MQNKISMDPDIVNNTIRFLNSSIRKYCFGEDDRYPKVMVLKSDYLWPYETCVDGKTSYCNKDYCNSRGKADPCCEAQTVIQSLVQSLDYTKGSGDQVTAQTLNCQSSGPSYETFVLSLVSTLLVLFVLSTIWFSWKYCRAKKLLNDTSRFNQEESKTIDESKQEDGDSGNIDVSQFSSLISNKSLTTSRGSLNKTKIHCNPEDHESRIENGEDRKHRRYVDTNVSYREDHLVIEEEGQCTIQQF